MFVIAFRIIFSNQYLNIFTDNANMTDSTQQTFDELRNKATKGGHLLTQLYHLCPQFFNPIVIQKILEFCSISTYSIDRIIKYHDIFSMPLFSAYDQTTSNDTLSVYDELISVYMDNICRHNNKPTFEYKNCLLSMLRSKFTPPRAAIATRTKVTLKSTFKLPKSVVTDNVQDLRHLIDIQTSSLLRGQREKFTYIDHSTRIKLSGPPLVDVLVAQIALQNVMIESAADQDIATRPFLDLKHFAT